MLLPPRHRALVSDSPTGAALQEFLIFATWFHGAAGSRAGGHSADLNEDGHMEVVATDSSGNLRLCPGNANHDTSTARVSLGTSWTGYDIVALQDVTGDGNPDIINRFRLTPCSPTRAPAPVPAPAFAPWSA